MVPAKQKNLFLLKLWHQTIFWRIALCLAASGIPDEIDFLPEEPINDEKGLPMQICHQILIQ